MRLIAHRGNLFGPSPLENNPLYIEAALAQGFDAEIDVWYVNGGFWLGHDEAKYPIKKSFLDLDFENPIGFWCHAKNEDAFKALLDIGANCFWHDTDKYTLTSTRVIWTYPGAPNIGNCIWNQPEWENVSDLYEISKGDMDKWVGICSDYVSVLKGAYEQTLLAKRDF